MREKISYWLLILLIIFLPTQLGRHFWYDSALIMGRRIDYLAPVIYLTDIIVVFLFIVWVVNKIISKIKNQKSKSISKFKNNNHYFDDLNYQSIKKFVTCYMLHVTCLVWFVGSLWAAQNKIITAWYFLKILEYAWLGWFLMARIGLIRQISPISQIWQFLAIPVIYESVLAIWQVIGQKSVGGIWWWLGERSFSAATPGIAQFIWQGELFLRGYGTFSHPNVLAGFLLITLIILSKISLRYWPKILIFLLGGLGIFVSGSRLVWGLAAIWGVYEIISSAINNISSAYFLNNFSPATPPMSASAFAKASADKSHTSGVLPARCFSSYIRCYLLVAFGVLLCIFAIISYVNFSDPSIILRLKLNDIALQMFVDHWLFGVGLMNFVVQLPNYTRDFEILRFLQPAHNVFLLAASEIGLIGLICLTCLAVVPLVMAGRRRVGLIWLKRRAIFARKNLFLLSVIVVISLFDHYFWTTQQGQLIILLVFVKFISGFNDREQINKVE